MKKYIKLYLLFALSILVYGCEDFLDAKPQKSLVIPTTLLDYQAILDAVPRQMNYAPKAPLLGSDEMLLGPFALSRLNQEDQSVYRWQDQLYAVNDVGVDWVFGYQASYYANVVLDELKQFRPANESERLEQIRLEASARFYRAWSHFFLLQLYAAPYNPSLSNQQGIPIRTTSDINISTELSDQKEVYDFILEDLSLAKAGLPEVSELKTRPSQWAVEALKSRIYLQMQEYSLAFESANNALEIGDDLIDYKNFTSVGRYFFPRMNSEVIFHANLATTTYTFNREQWVDPNLYELYEEEDLRKSIFFEQSRVAGFYNYVARYSGDFVEWGGLAVDELVLNRAESSFRIGNESGALDDLNLLLSKRYDEEFVPLELSGRALLGRILQERRKQLLFRGIRWMDLRRLNQDPEWAVTLRRVVAGESLVLEPGGEGYTLPIPPRELWNNPKLK